MLKSTQIPNWDQKWDKIPKNNKLGLAGDHSNQENKIVFHVTGQKISYTFQELSQNPFFF